MNFMRYQVSRQGDIVDRGVFAVSGPHRVQVEMPTSGRHRTLDVTTQVQALVDSGHVAMDFKLGGFKSEVQHLQPCKVRRCKAPQDTTSNFSLKSA